MYFIGIIAKESEYEMLKNNMILNNITIININKENIQNFKNVKFDTIVIIDKIEELYEKSHYIEDICRNINYLVINTDILIENKIFTVNKPNIITYGGNHKSTVTFSSITEETILISVQRKITNKNGEGIEVGEYIYKNNQKNLYVSLIEFILKRLYC